MILQRIIMAQREDVFVVFFIIRYQIQEHHNNYHNKQVLCGKIKLDSNKEQSSFIVQTPGNDNILS